MIDATLQAVCVGQPETHIDPDAQRDAEWTSAIWKRPVAGSAELTSLGIVGDAVANPDAHGGVDKAVLAYSQDHGALWNDLLPELETTPGAFGENLAIVGQAEPTVCLGDRYQIGEAVLEVSHPRQPCWKLARRHRMPDLPKRTIALHRYGWYLRVIASGLIEAGQTVACVARPYPDWPIARVAEVFYSRRERADEAAALKSLEVLAAAWRDLL